MCQPNNLFDHDDAEELSIDLNDGADFGHNDNFAPPFSHPQQTQGLNMVSTSTNKLTIFCSFQDKSFMSDFPEDFLSANPRLPQAQMQGAPASGADGGQSLFAGTKRRRVTPKVTASQQDNYSAIKFTASTQISSALKQEPLAEDQYDILSVNEDELPYGYQNNPTDSSLDSIAAMKKAKNREAAKRSRAKKKAEQSAQYHSNDKVIKENNKLKLDNAALRAENQILKKQLNFFENLFAKKQTQNQQQMAPTYDNTS